MNTNGYGLLNRKSFIVILLCLILASCSIISYAADTSQENSYIVENGEKEIKISLNGTSNGVNLQKGQLETVNGLTDFYINNGMIICLNGAKINGVSAQKDINNDVLKNILSIDNMKNSIEAKKGTVYAVISPRGCFGAVVFSNIDESQNIYEGIAISSPLDNALKKDITESSKKGNKDTKNSGGMDTIKTGGMDTISSGGMDTISLGGMDTIKTGGYDYFDTEGSSNISEIIFEGQQVQFKVQPRKYYDGEVLVLLKDIAPLFGLTYTPRTEAGIEKDIMDTEQASVEIEAYSDAAYWGTTEIKMQRAPKMDNNGIMVPLSFLSKMYGIHFSVSEDNKTLSISKEPVVEWRYAGYYNEEPYEEYESMFVDGVKTEETRTNGNTHVFKDITLYNKNTGETMSVPENQVELYAEEWSTAPSSPDKSDNTSTASSATSPNNPLFINMNMQRFFKSSTFNTWGGQMIRRMVP